jgi:hypothetical protein
LRPPAYQRSQSSSAKKGLIKTEMPCEQIDTTVWNLVSPVIMMAWTFWPTRHLVPDGLDTIRRATQVEVTQQHIRTHDLLFDQRQAFRRRCNDGGVSPSFRQQSSECRANGRFGYTSQSNAITLPARNASCNRVSLSRIARLRSLNKAARTRAPREIARIVRLLVWAESIRTGFDGLS